MCTDLCTACIQTLQLWPLMLFHLCLQWLPYTCYVWEWGVGLCLSSSISKQDIRMLVEWGVLPVWTLLTGSDWWHLSSWVHDINVWCMTQRRHLFMTFVWAITSGDSMKTHLKNTRWSNESTFLLYIFLKYHQYCIPINLKKKRMTHLKQCNTSLKSQNCVKVCALLRVCDLCSLRSIPGFDILSLRMDVLQDHCVSLG